MLVDEGGSASSISKRLGLNLAVVSYHLNQVLAKECDVIELIESVPRRGAIEKIYRLKFQALTEGEVAARDTPGQRKMSLEECIIVAVAAMDGGAFAGLPGSGWDWSLVKVDSDSWEKIREARRDFDRLVQAAAASRREPDGEPLQDVVVGVAAFPSLVP